MDRLSGPVASLIPSGGPKMKDDNEASQRPPKVCFIDEERLEYEILSDRAKTKRQRLLSMLRNVVLGFLAFLFTSGLVSLISIVNTNYSSCREVFSKDEIRLETLLAEFGFRYGRLHRLLKIFEKKPIDQKFIVDILNQLDPSKTYLHQELKGRTDDELLLESTHIIIKWKVKVPRDSIFLNWIELGNKFDPDDPNGGFTAMDPPLALFPRLAFEMLSLTKDKANQNLIVGNLFRWDQRVWSTISTIMGISMGQPCLSVQGISLDFIHNDAMNSVDGTSSIDDNK